MWWLRDTIGVLGFGFFLGLRMAASGWQTLAVRPRSDGDEFARPEDEHPNRALGLPPHPIIGFIHRDAIVQAGSRTPTDFYWSLIFVVGVLRDPCRPRRRRVDAARAVDAGGRDGG